jgi:hypothetical protein
VHVANVVGQKQNQFGVDHLALRIGEITMRVNQRLIKIIAGGEITKIAFTFFVKIGL